MSDDVADRWIIKTKLNPHQVVAETIDEPFWGYIDEAVKKLSHAINTSEEKAILEKSETAALQSLYYSIRIELERRGVL